MSYDVYKQIGEFILICKYSVLHLVQSEVKVLPKLLPDDS